MFSSLFSLLVGVSAFSFQAAPPAAAENEPIRDVIIMNAWIDPANCNRVNAKPVTFSELTAEVDRFKGECVAVRGYRTGRALFRSARDARSHRSNTSEKLQGRRIGLYAQWELIGESSEKATQSLFVGRVGACETQWPDVIMVMGYCHYTSGPILLVSQSFPH
jgi:hypothetical protein